MACLGAACWGMQLCIHLDYDTTCKLRSPPVSLAANEFVLCQPEQPTVVFVVVAAAGCFDSTHCAGIVDGTRFSSDA